MLRLLTAALLISFLAACSTVTIQPQQSAKLSSEPTYKDSKPFFLWGLVGEHRVDTAVICDGAEPKQMQSQQTFTDGLLGVITLGIYLPHTAKVWC
uniref:Bor family protein n=1 Tax=Rheinheimera sp. TaxID=1869214 RepID=UPI004047FFFD